MQTAQAYKKQASLIKALAHPTRLRILDVLACGEACVCHLTTILGKRQPNVSQHLMVLREAGLVKERKDGLIVYYRLADPRIKEIVARTKEMLLSSEPGLSFPEVPKAPLPGCPCPMCNGERL